MPCTSQSSESCWWHVREPSHSCRPNIYKLWTSGKNSLRRNQNTRIQTKEILKSKLKSFCNITTPINTAGSRAGKKTLMNWFAQTHATAHACLSGCFRSVLWGSLAHVVDCFCIFHFLYFVFFVFWCALQTPRRESWWRAWRSMCMYPNPTNGCVSFF